MFSILFFPTMRCNLKCSYCHFRVEPEKTAYNWTGYDKTHRIEGERTVEEYLKFFKTLPSYHLELSGGEPTLYRGFADLINNLPNADTWAITSNTTTDISKINLSSCSSWTASYHFEMEKHPSLIERFFENIHYLKNNKINVSISMVVTKDNIDQVIGKAFRFNILFGVRINLLRELNPGVDWRESTEWKMLLMMRNLGVNVVEEDIPESYNFEKGYYCEGGNKYFAIMPDGHIYRCYTEAMTANPIGTIERPPRQKGPKKCFVECLGCAMDHRARLYKLDREVVKNGC